MIFIIFAFSSFFFFIKTYIAFQWVSEIDKMDVTSFSSIIQKYHLTRTITIPIRKEFLKNFLNYKDIWDNKDIWDSKLKFRKETDNERKMDIYKTSYSHPLHKILSPLLNISCSNCSRRNFSQSFQWYFDLEQVWNKLHIDNRVKKGEQRNHASNRETKSRNGQWKIIFYHCRVV